MKIEHIDQSLEKYDHAQSVMGEREALIKNLELQQESASPIRKARLIGIKARVEESIDRIGEHKAAIADSVQNALSLEMNKVRRLFEGGYIPQENFNKAVEEHEQITSQFSTSPRQEPELPVSTIVFSKPELTQSNFSPSIEKPIIEEPQTTMPIFSSEEQAHLSKLKADEIQFLRVLQQNPQGITTEELKARYGITAGPIAVRLRTVPFFSNLRASSKGRHGIWQYPDTPVEQSEKPIRKETIWYGIHRSTGETKQVELNATEALLLNLIADGRGQTKILEEALEKQGRRTPVSMIISNIRTKAVQSDLPFSIHRPTTKTNNTYTLSSADEFEISNRREEVELIRQQVFIDTTVFFLKQAGIVERQYVADTSRAQLMGMLLSQTKAAERFVQESSEKGLTVRELLENYTDLLLFANQQARSLTDNDEVHSSSLSHLLNLDASIDILRELGYEAYFEADGFVIRKAPINERVAKNILGENTNILQILANNWDERIQGLEHNTHELGKTRSFFHPRSLFYLLREGHPLLDSNTEVQDLKQVLYQWLSDTTVHHLPIEWNQEKVAQYIDGMKTKITNGAKDQILTPSYLQTMIQEHIGISLSEETASLITARIRSAEEARVKTVKK